MNESPPIPTEPAAGGVALILLPTDFSDANRLYEAFQRRPPLGLQYLQAVLHRDGVRTDLLDAVLEPFSPDSLVARIRKVSLVGFYVTSVNRQRVCRTVRHIRRQLDVPVIAGGPGSIHAEELLQWGVDAVCMGEGEEVIREVWSALGQGRGFSGIRGIAYRQDGKTVFTEPRPLLSDLDGVPFPHRDPSTVTRYYDYMNPMVRIPCITLTASRGCYYHCSFCYSHRFWRGRYRLRSVENVMEEIRKTRRDFGARYLLFLDDVFPQKTVWVDSFVERLRAERFRVPWMCILNPNSFQRDRPNRFRELRDAGCNVISFGAQSSDPEILRAVHRSPGEAKQLYEAVRTARKLGILTVVTYILGLPGETEETARATVGQMTRLRPHLMDAHVLEVLPGSEIGETFPNGAVTELDQDRLRKIRRGAFLRFYANPLILLRLFRVIATENPKWFLLFPFRPVWAAVKRRKRLSG